MRAVVVMVAVMVGMGSAKAEPRLAIGEPRELFSECSPMDVKVAVGKEFAKRFRLTSEEVMLVKQVLISQVAERELYLPIPAQVPSRMQALEIKLEAIDKVVIFTLRLKPFYRPWVWPSRASGCLAKNGRGCFWEKSGLRRHRSDESSSARFPGAVLAG